MKKIITLIFAILFIPSLCGADSLQCPTEIRIGEAVDATESLAYNLLDEMETIYSEGIYQIESAREIINLSSEYKCENCSTSMSTSESCCNWYCCVCKDCPPPSDGDSSFNWLDVVYAEDCACGCESWCCSYYRCSSCSCSTCKSTTSWPQASTEDKVSDVASAYNDISSAYDEIQTLLYPGEYIAKDRILEILDDARSKLNNCYTPKTCYEQIFLYGECTIAGENVEIKGLLTCSDADTLEIKKGCYGSKLDSELLDNYFCCY